MPRVEVAEQPGVGVDGSPRPSEDVVVVGPDSVVVLDGATTLRPGLPSGGWYAERLGEIIANRLAATPGLELAEVLAASIAELAAGAGLVPGRSPSSTVALVRWTEDAVDALVLGDSPVVVFGATGPRVLADDRLAALPRAPGGYRDRLRTGGGFDGGHLAALRAGGSAMDRLRNREGGFWVAEADPDAAYHARTARWPRPEVRSVLVATDGVSCGVDDYRVYSDWAAVLRQSVEFGLLSVLNAIRAAERADPAGIRWPRPKKHDDQALVHLNFTVPPK
jgi:hypothetical protein